MRILLVLGSLVMAGNALAELPPSPQQLFDHATIWRKLERHEKAIEAFEQSYLESQKALCLYYMAESYEALARIPIRSTSESLYNKQRALELYRRYVEEKEAEEWPDQLEKARARIEPLRREIEELSTQMAEQEATLKDLRNDIKQLLSEVRTLRELLLRLNRGGTPAGFLH